MSDPLSLCRTMHFRRPHPGVWCDFPDTFGLTRRPLRRRPDEMRGLAVLIEGDTIQSFLQHVADAEEAEEA